MNEGIRDIFARFEKPVADLCRELGIEPAYRLYAAGAKSPRGAAIPAELCIIDHDFATVDRFEIHYALFDGHIRPALGEFLKFLQTYVPPVAHAVCRSGEGAGDARELDMAPTSRPSAEGVVDRPLTDTEIEACINGITAEKLKKVFVGESPAVQKINERLDGAAKRINRYDSQSRSTSGGIAGVQPPHVLILGETGAGKEVVMKALVARLTARKQSIQTCNCATFSRDEANARSELFGHRKGAFTGASEERVGVFVRAHKGVLYLDEIGDMPLRIFPQLNRCLETGKIRVLGDSEESGPYDVLVIAATNKDITKEETFRQDLRQRFSQEVKLPPLREHRMDIPLLMERFLDDAARKYGGDARRVCEAFDNAAVRRLVNYAWPGNVRELKRVIERVYNEFLFADPVRKVGPVDLPEDLKPKYPLSGSPSDGRGYRELFAEYEKQAGRPATGWKDLEHFSGVSSEALGRQYRRIASATPRGFPRRPWH